MNRPGRYILYLAAGMGLYQLVNTGMLGINHQQLRNFLLVGILVVFVLLLFIRSRKNKMEDKE